jgi:hypothetical protein
MQHAEQLGLGRTPYGFDTAVAQHAKLEAHPRMLETAAFAERKAEQQAREADEAPTHESEDKWTEAPPNAWVAAANKVHEIMSQPMALS